MNKQDISRVKPKWIIAYWKKGNNTFNQPQKKLIQTNSEAAVIQEQHSSHYRYPAINFH